MPSQSLQPSYTNQQLSLATPQFGVQLNLGQALLTQVLLNTAVSKNAEALNQKLVTHFCQSLITSLSLVTSRHSQLAINELELSALACLLKKLTNLPEEELLTEKLSARRLSQAQEEASYLNSLPAEEEIRQFLLPAFSQLNAYLAANQLSWPDPEGIYF